MHQQMNFRNILRKIKVVGENIQFDTLHQVQKLQTKQSIVEGHNPMR